MSSAFQATREVLSCGDVIHRLSDCCASLALSSDRVFVAHGGDETTPFIIIRPLVELHMPQPAKARRSGAGHDLFARRPVGILAGDTQVHLWGTETGREHAMLRGTFGKATAWRFHSIVPWLPVPSGPAMCPCGNWWRRSCSVSSREWGHSTFPSA